MTRESMIKVLRYKAEHIKVKIRPEFFLEVAEAIEQEPRWVLYEGDGYADGKMAYDIATCPNCGHEFDEGDSNWQEACFCPNCGQALRWE